MLKLVILDIRTTFWINQNEHNYSFHTTNLDSTIILVTMLGVEKPCFCNNDINVKVGICKKHLTFFLALFEVERMQGEKY
jgi:hypothetical protein